jgi:undecaprenyl-diphosphatase
VRRSLVYTGAGATLGPAVVLAAAGVGEEPGALSDWQALVLGLVQGATELLPISSSAHLILVPWLGDWTYLEQHDSFNQTFDVALHLGTLIAVVVYFWHEIVAITVAWVRTLRRRAIDAPEERIAWIVIVATLPAALVGLAFEDQIAEYLGEPWQIAIVIAVFALVLLWADRRAQRRIAADLSLVEALGVGAAQALALIPGVSRSGITISAGRFLGLDRDSAARFSFLLLLPITFAAVLFKGLTDVVFADLPSGMAGPFVVGVLASLGSGLLAIVGLLDYVRRHNYDVFVVYRLIVAAVIILLIVTGARAATF